MIVDPVYSNKYALSINAFGRHYKIFGGKTEFNLLTTGETLHK